MKLVFDVDALLEAREAAVWYENTQPGLGRAFLDAIEEATSDILQHPLRWRRIKGRFRRRLLRRFPFGLIYAIEDDVIKDLAESSGGRARYRVVERVASGKIDEVWLWGAPYFGYWESTMVGKGAYWCNSSPVEGVESKRRFVIRDRRGRGAQKAT